MTPDKSREWNDSSPSSRDERWLDLVAMQLSTGLDADDRRLFEALAIEHGQEREETWEQLAGQVALACAVERYEPLPERLRDRLRREAVAADAVEAVANRGPGSGDMSEHATASSRAASSPLPGLSDGRGGLQTASEERPSRGMLGWLAAAVCLAVAVLGWGQAWNKPLPASPATARARLVERNEPRLVRIAWTATDDAAVVGDPSAAGDVVFDPATQEGYMRFRGLAANDPGREQYQLWIFDARQDERYPVDGGVFDIPQGAAEVIVPIRPAIVARAPVMFAITVEKPGGVVVSSRERLPLLAKLD
jgi:hypothetical protein